MRDRAVPDRRVWAAAKPRARDRRGRPSPLRDPSAPSARGGARRGPGRRLGASAGRGRAGRMRHRPGDGSAVYPVHVGHDRRAQGDRARHGRLRRRAAVVDGGDLRRRARRRLLGGVRHRLGCRPLVHRLRAAPAGLHQHPLRGQAGRYARCRRVLARVRGPRGGCVVHRPHGDQGDQAGGPGRRAHARPRPVAAAHAVPGRRAMRPGHAGVGRAQPRSAGDRPLVADRDRLADRGQLHRRRTPPGAARLLREGGPGLRPAGARRTGRAGACRGNRCTLREAAAAAGLQPHAVGWR